MWKALNRPLKPQSLLVLLVALGALVVDPLFLNPFDYDDDDMRAVVEGTWRLTLESNDGKTRHIVFRIEQGAEAARTGDSPIRGAAACSHRSFVRSASACTNSSRMPLTVTVLQGKATIEAEFSVFGKTFDSGVFRISIKDELGSVYAKIARNGEITSVDIHPHRARLERVPDAALFVTQ